MSTTIEARRAKDTAELAAFFEQVRAAFPEATQVKLETSDQNRYGFSLQAVIVGDVTINDGDTFDTLQDDAWDHLCDLDWDGVVGEDKHGYATLTLPAVEPQPAEDWEVQGNYGHGWECVTGASSKAEAEGYLADYRANEPGTSFRIKRIS